MLETRDSPRLGWGFSSLEDNFGTAMELKPVREAFSSDGELRGEGELGLNVSLFCESFMKSIVDVEVKAEDCNVSICCLSSPSLKA
jgi:hypothetical protein